MNPFSQALEKQNERGLLRSLTPLLHAPSKFVVREGVHCLNFASNNSLDLAGHPLLRARAQEALDEAGTGSGGSRLLGGNLPLHAQLEDALIRYRPLGNGLVFNSGFQANLTMVSALGDALGGAFADKLAHASVAEGLRLMRSPFHRFRHNDANQLEDLLKRHQPKEGGLVVAETLYSMEGDFAPLADLCALQRQYGFWLLLDEAHSTGCYPDLHVEGLRGFSERTALMGTFGKALGSFGAYVAGPSELIAYLVNFGRGFIFSTSLPPAVIGANLGALEAVQHEDEAWRPARLQKISAMAREALAGRGFQIGASESHIVPILLGSPERAACMSALLFDQGIHAPAIRPPSVPAGVARLRLNFTAAFEEEDVARLADALEAARKAMDAQGIP